MPEKIRVLYVDDESTLLDIGKQVLEQSGDFTVTTATSVPEALRLLERERFDVIVSDYQMPEMDGIEFLVLVRTKFGEIPFILFTGKGREEVVIEALNAGADGYLQKGSELKSQFAELSHKIKSAASRKKADDALKRSEENYRHLIEHADEAIVVAQDGMLRLVNRRTVELTGYSAQELLSMSFLVFIHPDDRAMVMERYQKRMKGEESPSRYSFRLSPKDGSPRWVEISVAAIDWDGRPATLNFLTDITERKQADEALAESEGQKIAILNGITTNIAFVDKDLRLLWVNKFAAESVHKSPAEMIGHTCHAMWADPARPCENCPTLKVFETKQSEHTVMHTPDGRVWDERGEPVFDEKGNLIGVVEIAQDITERKRVEEALKENEERYRNLFESSRDAMMTLEPPSWRFTSCNPATVQIFMARDEAEFTSKEPWIHSPERQPDGCDSGDKAKEMIETAVRNGSHFFEWTHKRLNGEDFPATVLLSKVELAGKVFLQATVRDITERKKAEEEIIFKNILFQTQQETSLDGILVVDEKGKILSYNRHFIELWDIPEDVIGTRFDELALKSVLEKLTHPEEFLARVNYLYTHKSDKSHEEIMLKDGRALERYSAPMFGEERNYYGRVWYFRDITERKRAEEALAESEEKIRLLLNSTAEAIYGLDMNGNCTFCNSACLHLLGYKHPDELLGRNMHWQIHAKHPDGTYFPVEDCRIFQAFNKGEGTHVDDEVLWRSDGTSFPAEYWSYPQRREGVVVGAVVTFLDITERKRAEEAIRQANKQLNLLSDITRHDILNQLFALKGYLELSQDVIDKPETLREFIKKEQQAANTIEQQIQFTKDYQKLGAAAPAWQNVNASIQKAVAGLPMRAIHVEPDPADPEVYADALFDKVFYNLIDNALCYGGDQMKTIRVSSQESNTSLTILCEDDGVGISAEDKKKLFRKGFGKHTGLGLSLSREILAITGITITENGVPGTGARFEITVPKGMWRMAGADGKGD